MQGITEYGAFGSFPFFPTARRINVTGTYSRHTGMTRHKWTKTDQLAQEVCLKCGAKRQDEGTRYLYRHVGIDNRGRWNYVRPDCV